MKRKSKRTFLQWLKSLLFFREYKRKDREIRRQKHVRNLKFLDINFLFVSPMRIFYFIVAIFLAWSCSGSEKIKSNEPSADFKLLVGEWKNISVSDVSASDNWLGNSLFLNIEENGFIKNDKGQQVQAGLDGQYLCIEKDSVAVRYRIKSDAGFIDVQMIKNNETTSSYLFKRVQDSLVGVWICAAEEAFHQIDGDGWVNNDWIWSFQGPLSFYNNNTCINKKGDIAQWEINNSILTIKYKEHSIDWKVTGHYTLTWEKERAGFTNKDRHVYSFVSSEFPTFNQQSHLMNKK